MKLPCDVLLPPSTLLNRGEEIANLFKALALRENRSKEANTFHHAKIVDNAPAQTAHSAPETKPVSPPPARMRRVLIESPFRGDNYKDHERNKAYARQALLDALMRGEAPLASHIQNPEVLDDRKPDERQLGIDAGLAWVAVADAMALYIDYGISGGMELAMRRARDHGIPVEMRSICVPNYGQEANS